MSDERWYFSKEQLVNSPSRRLGINADEELNYKQLAANLIYDMGSRKLLSVNQLCISTAIVYMHRFYVFHSFTHFQWHTIAMASLFLAAKVEEQTRKIEQIIKTAQWCLQRSQANINCVSESYLDQVQELIMNENILLQTLGFDVIVKHPHTFVVEFCEKIKLNKDVTKTMYGMASNSLHVTTMCVQYKPSVVACFCIHFISKRSNHRIKMKDESQTWWSHIDPSVTQELLEQMTTEFLYAYEKSPPKLKYKIQELLKCKNLSGHQTEHKLDISGQSSDSLHSSASTSSSSSSSFASTFSSTFASSSMFQHGETQTADQNVHGLARMHRPTPNYLPNRQQNSHLAWSAILNDDFNTFTNTQNPPTQQIKSNPATQVAWSQQQQQGQYSLHQQHSQHRHHASLAFHDVSQPKIATIAHLTSASDSKVVSTKHMMKPDSRIMNVMTKKSDLALKHEPRQHCKITSVRSLAEPPCGTAGVNPPQKVDYPSGSVSSSMIQDMPFAKPIEHRTQVKTEPSESTSHLYANTDTVDSSTYNVGISKSSRNHSIFSPSPVHNESTFPIELPIEQEVSLVKEEIIQESLPIVTQVHQESSMTTHSHHQACIDVTFSDLTRDMENVETVVDQENIFMKNRATTASSAYTTEQPVFTSVVINNTELTRKEPPNVKSEPCECPELSSISKLPLPSQSAGKNAVLDGTISIAIAGEYCTESCRKMKKDKHHKEKKRHKDDRHRHHKDHRCREKQYRKPEPIKITIPKEKLTNVPANPPLKINANQIVTYSSASKDVTLNNSSSNVSKSLKRKRESDHGLPPGMHPYNLPNSFKDFP